ncbi:hypothetical protein BDY24DRAFT_388955 [Mrakia frigida]|uniref:uncharacterized protein n=1 Tax=Mrakia frigida TaxID=29902 RepID=UPI003FCBEF04
MYRFKSAVRLSDLSRTNKSNPSRLPLLTISFFIFLSFFALLSVHLLNGTSSYRERADPPSASTSFPSAIPALPPLQALLQQTRLPKEFNWAEKAQDHNDQQMTRLWWCTQKGERCTDGRKEEMVVILAAEEYRIGWSGWTGGETIWAMSVFRTMDSLGYTTIVSANLNQTIAYHHLFAPWVKVIVVKSENAFNCFRSPACIKQSSDDALGIPLWKVFSFHFWAGPNHPLGSRWTLSPEPPPDRYGGEPNFDLGYSFEKECSKDPLVPHSERVNQAFLYAKHSEFFTDANYAWSDLILNTTSTNLNLTFVGAPIVTPGFPTLPPALHILNPWGGLLEPHDFFDQLGRSIALVGIGDPPLSPSPYDALCRGTPFINPILEWDVNAKEDRTRWVSQQRTLKHFDPPYVYNVFRGDGEGLEKALREAREKPFEGRFIPPRMKEEEMRKRVTLLVEGKWREEAEELLKVRTESGEGELFIL